MKKTKNNIKDNIRLSPGANNLERFIYTFSSHWKVLLYWQDRVIKTPDLDDVHNLRISLRRFRLSVKLYEYFTSTKAKKKFKKSLKQLTNSLGNLRDIDEAFSYFHAQDNIGKRHQIYKYLKEMRSVQLKLIKDILRKFVNQFDNLVKEMIAQLMSIPFMEGNNLSILTHASNVSSELSKTIHKHLEIATKTKQRKSRHTLRIAIRKWRYYLELFSLVLNRDYDSLLAILTKYQSLLGQINDISSFLDLCSDMPLSPTEDKFIKKNLLEEQQHLLIKFNRLVKQHPL